MNTQLRCANGHSWAESTSSSDETADFAKACPICGSTVLPVNTEAGEVGVGSATHESPEGKIASQTPAGIKTSEAKSPVTVVSNVTVEIEAHHARTLSFDDKAPSPADPNAGTLTLDPVAPAGDVRSGGLDSDSPDAANDSGAVGRLTGIAGLGHETGIAAKHDNFTAKRPAAGATNIGVGRLKKEPKLPEKIAGYEILAELGRGGMGVVYKARQPGLNRICALKMILGGGRASADAIARFKVEAEAIAYLQHPNIVQVYEIGEDNDCPYFSLEFVEGSNLQNLIAGTPQSAAVTARMMLQICDGVYAAHQRGILHRDLKPANVLLTNDNVPKITDFGLAKRLEEKDTGQTRTGAVMGTPSYMAPEQAMGRSKEVGPPADIYALGAVLYDMLTGRPPFRGESVMDTLNQVQNLDPLPPARLVPKVALDLQTICLKALNKDPKQRYTTAGEMGEDLRRFLAGEPILARPTPTWERTVKWVKRRPALATLIGVTILALLCVLTLGGMWLDSERRGAKDREAKQAELRLAAEDREKKETELRQEADVQRVRAEDNFKQAREAEKKEKELRVEADTQRLRAEENLKEADVQRARAEVNFKDARNAVDVFLTRVGKINLKREPGMERIRRELLEEALAYKLKFLKQNDNELSVRSDAAHAHEEVGKIYRELGKYHDSTDHYQTALERFRELSHEFPDRVDYRQAEANSLSELALVQQLQGLFTQSERGYLNALQLFEKLAIDHPKEASFKEHLAYLHYALGGLCTLQEQYAAATTHFETSVKLRSALIEKGFNSTESRQRLAGTQLNQGSLQFKLGNVQKAEQSLLAARKVFAELMKEVPDEQEYATEWGYCCINLSSCYRKHGRPEDAIAVLGDAIGMFQKLHYRFPGTPVYRQRLASANYQTGMILGEQGKVAQALDFLGQALQVRKQLHEEYPQLQDSHFELAQAHVSTGIAQIHLKQVDDALKNYRSGVELLEGLAPKADSAPNVCAELARGHENLAELLTALKEPLEADKSWERLLNLRTELVQTFPQSLDYQTDLAETHSLFAQRFQKSDKNSEAMSEWKAAASGFGRCMILAEENKSLAAENRKALLADYGNRTLAALTRAVETGFKDTTYLKTAPELRLLRELEGFRALMTKMEKKEPKQM